MNSNPVLPAFGLPSEDKSEADTYQHADFRLLPDEAPDVRPEIVDRIQPRRGVFILTREVLFASRSIFSMRRGTRSFHDQVPFCYVFHPRGRESWRESSPRSSLIQARLLSNSSFERWSDFEALPTFLQARVIRITATPMAVPLTIN